MDLASQAGCPAVYRQRTVAMPHLERACVEAVQWTGENLTALAAAFPEAGARLIGDDPNNLAVTVTGGQLFLRVGWWLVRAPDGYLCAMFPWAFTERYAYLDHLKIPVA